MEGQAQPAAGSEAADDAAATIFADGHQQLEEELAQIFFGESREDPEACAETATRGRPDGRSLQVWQSVCSILDRGVEAAREWITPTVVIDFPYCDNHNKYCRPGPGGCSHPDEHLHLAKGDGLLERGWVFAVKGQAFSNDTRLMLHGHTFGAWHAREGHDVKNRADLLTSVNWRIAQKGGPDGWSQDGRGNNILPVRDADVRWRKFYRQRSFEPVVWNWRTWRGDERGFPSADLAPGKREPDASQRLKYKRIQTLLKLADAAEAQDTYSKRETDQAIRSHGQVVSEMDITPLGARRPRPDLQPLDLSRMSLADGDSPWKDEPDWAALPSPRPLSAGRFCILVVGANNSDEVKLSVEQEINAMRAAFTAEWGADAWRDVVTFQPLFFADMDQLVRALMEFKPLGVHFVCHGFESALSLMDDLVSVETLTKALAAWAREDAFLRFVVANSCNSAALARALAEFIDFIVGHDSDVKDAAAVQFARVIYGSLGGGYSLATSFQLARATKGCRRYGMCGSKNAYKFFFPKPEKHIDCVEVGVGQVDSSLLAPRTAFMTKLGDLLSSEGSQRIAVVGQGGSGKSTLARCFLKNVSQSVTAWRSIRLVFFLQSSDMMQGYRDLLSELTRLSGGTEEKIDDDNEKVRSRVHTLLGGSGIKGRWVGVLDDLPGPESSDLQDFGMEWLLESFPWSSGKTIVTSRFSAWMGPRVFQRGFEVGNLETEEALGFLKSQVEHWQEDEDGVAKVARRLCYFPLALASAVGCANEYYLSTTAYIQELEKSRSKILERWSSRPRMQGEYPYELLEVVHATWQRLSEGADAIAVMQLLRQLAFLDPCDIPLEIFADLQEHLPILKSHCLVSVSPSASKSGPRLLVAIHALTQQVIREHLMGNAWPQVQAAVVAALQTQMDTFDEDKQDTYQSCTCRAYTAHVAAVMGHAEREGERVAEGPHALSDVENLARLAMRTGGFLNTVTCAFRDSKRMYEHALKAQLQLAGGEESAGVGACYRQIGAVHCNLSECKEALDHLQRALDIQTRVCGDFSPDVATTHVNIGAVHFNLADYEKALFHYGKAEEVFLAVYGRDHLDVAATYNNQGVVYEELSRFDDALEAYSKSRDIMIKVVGQDHPEVARTHGNMGNVHRALGNFEKALFHFGKANDVFIAVYGDNSLDVAATYNNQGIVYEKLARFDDALEAYSKSLDIKIKVVGHDSLDVAATYCNMGEVFREQGQYEKALEYYQKDLDITIKVVGHGHPLVAATLVNIGKVHYKQGKAAEAKELFARAYKIRLDKLGPNHPDTTKLRPFVHEVTHSHLRIAVGARIRIEGLKSSPQYNSCVGKVTGEAPGGRLSVELESNAKVLSLKRENLRVVSPNP